jgi:serine phosphatase RsbU (regulator of sigma subunit)
LDRNLSFLSWLLVPVAGALVLSALHLSRQPYTGLTLRGENVERVMPGSPGERAGLAAQDRALAPPGSYGARAHRPLVESAPGRPIDLVRVRGTERRTAWLVPDRLPEGERRQMSAQLVVASGFLLLGGWVWGQRRDRLTRSFFLLCLTFALLMLPPMVWSRHAVMVIDDVVRGAVQLYLPALFVHFFSHFPESRARGRTRVRVAYGISTALFALSLIPTLEPEFGRTASTWIEDLIQFAGGAWFAFGLFAAFVLFILSFRRAGSADARRRLRVALVGTVLGAAPLAAVVAIKNFSPGTTLPGERWAVLLTLMVPASFAWAAVVHRVFDFRVALRAAATLVIVALSSAIVYAAGEALAAAFWPDLGNGIAGATLAFVALAAAVAGPAAPWFETFGTRVVPDEDAASLASWSPPSATSLGPDDEPTERTLADACEAVMRYLKLDGCLALISEDHRVRPIGATQSSAMREPGPELRLRAAHLERSGVQSLEVAPLDVADREALDMAGVKWLLPVGSDPVRAVLLLGRRLAGSWLGRRESLELGRFAERLAMTLENAALRLEASSHGALERELAVAGAIQAHLLPRHAPAYPTLDCAAATLSSEPVGGDYYDFVQGPGRDFTLVVGDAAGKGVPAALVLAQVQSRFRSHALKAKSPGDLLSTMNRELVDRDQPDRFVGLLCARVDVRGARVYLANAGLTPPLVRRLGGEFEEVLGGGVLLGVSAEASYPDACVELEAGDVIVVYTDGLTEARRGEDWFGTERIREVLDRTSRRRAADILQALIDEVRGFSARGLDDLTVVVLKQLTEPTRNGSGASQFVLK